MWLYLPATLLASAPVSADSTLVSESLFHDLSQRVFVRGKLQRLKSWRAAWKKGRFTPLRSTLTCLPSTATLGVESYIQSLRDSLASPTQSPESNLATMTPEPSGQPSYEFWEKSSRTWFTSKTSPSLFDTSDQSEKRYRDWATQLKSRCSLQRLKLAQATSENDSSRWPTARSEDAESCGNHPEATDSLTGATKNWLTPHGMNGIDHSGKVGRGGEFAKQATEWEATPAMPSGQLSPVPPQWQTPATDFFRSRGGDRKDEMGLDQQSRFWRTPDAPSSTGGPRNRQESIGKGHQITIAEEAEHWNTPSTNDSTRANDGPSVMGRYGTPQMTASDQRLRNQVSAWGTPTTRDWKDGSSANTAPTNGLLGRQVIQEWPTPKASDDIAGSNSLNASQGKGGNNLLGAILTGPISGHQCGALGVADTLSGADAPAVPPNDEDSPCLLLDPALLISGKICWCGIRNCDQQSHRRKLNSLFTLWLMGLPLHWLAPEQTNSGRVATQSYLYRLRLQLEFLLKGRV